MLKRDLRGKIIFVGFSGVLASDDPDAIRTEFRADLVNQSRRSKKEMEDGVSFSSSV